MYLVEYWIIFTGAPLLWLFFLVVSALLTWLMFKVGNAVFDYGIPLIIASVIATFFPTDSAFCMKWSVTRSSCHAELGVGILILIGCSYVISAAVYSAFRSLGNEDEADYK